MISIALPIHGMKNADFFLQRCFDSILEQSYEDIEVVIADNSDDDHLLKIIQTYALPIKYFKNPKKGMAPNTNAAIKHSTGDVIKILYMDDWLAHKHALRDILAHFEGHWLVTSSDNNKNPHYTEDIETGNNKLGSPSALTVLNKKPLLFDENMTWLLDCDFYKRMYEKFGEPVIVKKVGVMMGIGDHQMTHILTNAEKDLEFDYMHKKYHV